MKVHLPAASHELRVVSLLKRLKNVFRPTKTVIVAAMSISQITLETVQICTS